MTSPYGDERHGPRTQVILSGPPGSGKSSLARLLATHLGRPHLDLDELVAHQTGCTPAELIRTRGEAFFRELEAKALEDAPKEAPVVALGGGALTFDRTRQEARHRGPVFGLTMPRELLDLRLATSKEDRPLLDGGALDTLLDTRSSTYRAVDDVIDGNTPPTDLARLVLDRARELRILVTPVGSTSTRVLVGRNLSIATAGAVHALRPRRTVLLIEDAKVPKPKRDQIAQELSLLPLCRIEVPGGESVKEWSTLGTILDRAIRAGCGRQSAVLGIGGGATCDLAALAAALLGRGAPVVLAPSTLLAMADAAVGGKCAVNVGGARNLAGTFHPASDVVADLDLLDSLAPDERRSGLAEVLKIGIISDPELFERVAATKTVDAEALFRSITRKAEVVAEDPEEHGRRKVLNLGHTLAHALEAASEFSMRHGDAVAIGICAATRLSTARGWADPAVGAKIIGAFESLGLPTHAPRPLLARSLTHLGADKKGDRSGIEVVRIEDLGKVSTLRLDLHDVADLTDYAVGGLHDPVEPRAKS